MRVTLILAFLSLAFFDAQVPPAIAQNDLNDTSYIWNAFHPEVQAVVQATIRQCNTSKSMKLAMKRKFDKCIEPTISYLKFDSFVNEQFEEFWNSLDLNEPLGDKTLEFIRAHLLAPFCHHAPMILNCFDSSFDGLNQKCWSRFDEQNLNLMFRLLPSICEYNGTRLEGIMNTGSQICLKSYLNQFEQCENSTRIAVPSGKPVDYETKYCSILSCMILFGNQSPCNARAEEDVSLQFLLDHVQYLIGCKTAGLVNVINKIHEESCETAKIPYEPLKNEEQLGICIEPFLAFADYVRHATNSTLKRTKHVEILKSDVESFRSRIDDICYEILYGQTCTAAIKDVMAQCYTTKKHQQWNAFVTYFHTFLQIECQVNGSRVIDLFENGDLQCFVSQITNIWACVDAREEENYERDMCVNLGLLHNCALEGMEKCTNPRSLQIVNDTFTDLSQHLLICKPVLNTQHQKFQPVVNDRETSMNTVAIIVIPLFSCFSVAIIGYLIIRFRRNRGRRASASPSETHFEIET